MKSFKIPDGENAEQAIRNHALATFSGCRELRYEVSTPTFDAIWQRTRAAVGRGTSKPRMAFDHGRHEIIVFADDAVPADEVKCLTADDATMCEAAPDLDDPGTFTHYDAAGTRTEHPRPRCDCGGILDTHPTVDAAVCRTCGKEITGDEHASAMRRTVESAQVEAAPNLDGQASSAPPWSDGERPLRERISTLEWWLGYALENWAPAGSDKAEKARKLLGPTEPEAPR